MMVESTSLSFTLQLRICIAIAYTHILKCTISTVTGRVVYEHEQQKGASETENIGNTCYDHQLS